MNINTKIRVGVWDVYPTVGYTYVVTHIPSGKRYYGCQWKHGAHPQKFWKSYFTSSKVVKKLIEKDGKDAFTTEIRRTFPDNPRDALLWEVRVLKRLDAMKNPNWLNRTNGHKNFNSTSIDTRQKLSKAAKGKPKSAEARQKMSEYWKGRKRHAMTETTKEKIRQKQIGKPPKNHYSVKVLVDNVQYNSIQEVSDKFCLSRGGVRRRLNSPTFPNWQRI